MKDAETGGFTHYTPKRINKKDLTVSTRLMEADEALELSIGKWTGILKSVEEDKGSRDCPLCQLYKASGCTGCVIKEATGIDLCKDTPYMVWSHHQDVHHLHEEYRRIHCSECERIAKDELHFLKSLRGSKKDNNIDPTEIEIATNKIKELEAENKALRDTIQDEPVCSSCFHYGKNGKKCGVTDIYVMSHHTGCVEGGMWRPSIFVELIKERK